MCAGCCFASTWTPVSIPPSPLTDTSSCESRARHAEASRARRRLHTDRAADVDRHPRHPHVRARRAHVRRHVGEQPDEVTPGRDPSRTVQRRLLRTGRSGRQGSTVSSQVSRRRCGPGSAVLEIRGASYDAGTLAATGHRRSATCSAPRSWTASSRACSQRRSCEADASPAPTYPLSPTTQGPWRADLLRPPRPRCAAPARAGRPRPRSTSPCRGRAQTAVHACRHEEDDDMTLTGASRSPTTRARRWCSR